MNAPTLKTRREFLRTTMLGGAASWTVPAFVESTFGALQAQAANSATRVPTGKDSTILVLLQVAGGNDGLNTVVPITNDHYYKARKTLALPPRSVLRLTSEFGLHPSLTGLGALYSGRQLAIVQGVGYPNPNRSHFRGTDIWVTASDAKEFLNSGWVGRYFDNACPGTDPTVGIALGRQRPLAFAGKGSRGINVDSPENYRFGSGDGTTGPEMAATDRTFRRLNQPAMKVLPGQEPGGSVDFVKRVALDFQVSSDQIRARNNAVPNRAKYPQSQLGNSLKMVARWIGGRMPTRVYYVSQGGYDTHINQATQHARLLKDLGDSIKAFTDDLKYQRNFDRVLLVTFSEFGRRVAENASSGTDHGAASMLFVVGSKVKAPWFGKFPSLAPKDLRNGDPVFTTDFRSVYAGILEHWLHTPSELILGGAFNPLPLV